MTFTPRTQPEFYAANNGEAARFMMQANADYMLARYGLNNGLFSGVWVGANAAEKYIKSVILYTGKIKLQEMSEELIKIANSMGIKRDKKHNLLVCLELAKRYGIKVKHLSSDQLELLNKFYNERYPDNPDLLMKGNTSWFQLIDLLIFSLWDNMKVLIPEVYYISGPHIHHYGYWMYERGGHDIHPMMIHYKNIMEFQNWPLQQRLVDTKEGCCKILDAWYPKVEI